TGMAALAPDEPRQDGGHRGKGPSEVTKSRHAGQRKDAGPEENDEPRHGKGHGQERRFLDRLVAHDSSIRQEVDGHLPIGSIEALSHLQGAQIQLQPSEGATASSCDLDPSGSRNRTQAEPAYSLVSPFRRHTNGPGVTPGGGLVEGKLDLPARKKLWR